MKFPAIFKKSPQNRAPPYVSGLALAPLTLGYGASMEAGLRAFPAVSTLFAIVDRLSESVAAVPWGLYRIDSDEEVPDHPAARLWAMPNEFYDQTDFLQTAQQHYDLTGEMVWNVSYSSPRVGPPLELWPIRPDKVSPVPSADSFLAGWVYRAAGQQIPWTTREVIQVKRPNPFDPYRGIAPVASALADVYGEQSAAAYNNAFFRNSAEPGGIIMVDRHLDDAEWEELTTRWREQHQGTDNAHRVAVLEKATFQERKYTMREMQFGELRKLNREFIRTAYGYPKPMLGDVEDVNKASAIAGEYVFARWLVVPRLQHIKTALNRKLLPLFGSSATGLEFRYGENGSEEVVPADRELQIQERESDANRVKTLIEAGFDPADVLEYCGLPPMRVAAKARAPVSEPGTEETAAEAQPATSNRGRPRIEDDAYARKLYDEGEALKAKHGLSRSQIAARLGLSDSTYARYRQRFNEGS